MNVISHSATCAPRMGWCVWKGKGERERERERNREREGGRKGEGEGEGEFIFSIVLPLKWTVHMKDKLKEEL